MTKQEFYIYLDELTSETGFDLTKEQKAFAYQAAKEYHARALRIHDVVERSEQCAHPRDKREYIGLNMLRCKVCGKEFS
jgi:hypothetical protein